MPRLTGFSACTSGPQHLPAHGDPIAQVISRGAFSQDCLGRFMVSETGTDTVCGGVPVPGAALRLLETTSGRAWISWTDENGRFSLPGLPPGHYRIEITQLGFEPSVKEFDLTAQGGTPVDLMLKVATLEVIEQSSQPAPPKQSARGPAAPPAGPTGWA